MRRDLALAALLLPLGGCYLPPPGQPAYAQPSYPPPAYAQPDTPPGYPPPGYDPDASVYPGYAYNNGSPTLFVDGAVMPLILFGGGWGYYDAYHNWHRAPDAVARHIEQQHAASGFRPPGAGFQPRPEGRPPPGAGPYGGQPGFRPNGPARPAAAPAHEDRPRGHDCRPGERC